jgi:hypothetical protein
MADHPEPAGDMVENLGDIFAEPRHAAAASWASAGAVALGFVDDLLPRQVVRQFLALWPDTLASRHRLVFGGRLADLFGFALFEFLKPQLELLDSPGHSFRRATELHPPQLGDLELQLLDFEAAHLDGELCRLQFCSRRRQFALAGQRKSAQCIRIGRQIG